MNSVPDVGALVRLHIGGCRFAEAAATFALSGRSTSDRTRFEALALFGQRLLRLDLVDLELADRPDLAGSVPAELADRAASLTFPRRPLDDDRGALGRADALIGHVLEAFEIRWRRSDMLQVVSLLHLLGEYVGHLVWSDTLGHGADPLRINSWVDAANSRWGVVDSDDCGHGRPQRHLARKVRDGSVLRSDERWMDFLRGDYSRVGEQLLVCSTREPLRPWRRRARGCDAACPVWTVLSESDQRSLARRTRLAVWFRTSPVVELRHGAPVGHFFGVPDRAEVDAAWDTLLRQLAKREDVHLGDGDLPRQLDELCGLMAGRELSTGSLIGDTVAALGALNDAR